MEIYKSKIKIYRGLILSCKVGMVLLLVFQSVTNSFAAIANDKGRGMKSSRSIKAYEKPRKPNRYKQYTKDRQKPRTEKDEKVQEGRVVRTTKRNIITGCSKLISMVPRTLFLIMVLTTFANAEVNLFEAEEHRQTPVVIGQVGSSGACGGEIPISGMPAIKIPVKAPGPGIITFENADGETNFGPISMLARVLKNLGRVRLLGMSDDSAKIPVDLPLRDASRAKLTKVAPEFANCGNESVTLGDFEISCPPFKNFLHLRKQTQEKWAITPHGEPSQIMPKGAHLAFDAFHWPSLPLGEETVPVYITDGKTKSIIPVVRNPDAYMPFPEMFASIPESEEQVHCALSKMSIDPDAIRAWTKLLYSHLTGKIKLIPFYGLHQLRALGGKIASEFLNNWRTALHETPLRDGTGPTPVQVLLVLNDLDDELRIQVPKVKKIEVLDSDGHRFRHSVEIVTAPRIPQELFQFIFQLSPPISLFEGANMETLSHQYGVPGIKILRRENGYTPLWKPEATLRERATRGALSEIEADRIYGAYKSLDLFSQILSSEFNLDSYRIFKVDPLSVRQVRFIIEWYVLSEYEDKGLIIQKITDDFINLKDKEQKDIRKNLRFHIKEIMKQVLTGIQDPSSSIYKYYALMREKMGKDNMNDHFESGVRAFFQYFADNR